MAEAFSQIQRCGHGQDEDGGDHEKPGDADRNAYRRPGEGHEQIVQGFDGDPGNLCAFLIKSNVKQLSVEVTDKGQRDEGNGCNEDEIGDFHGENGPEEKGVDVGAAPPGGQDDGQTDVERHDDGHDDFLVAFKPVAKVLNEQCRRQGVEQGGERRVHSEKIAQCHAGEGRVGKGIAHHGEALQNQKGTDDGAQNGDEKPCRQGVAHEIIL